MIDELHMKIGRLVEKRGGEEERDDGLAEQADA
jgi:hypothetical protein